MPRVPRRASGPPGEPRLVAYLYIAPAFLFLCFVLLVPLVMTAGLSLFRWDGVGPLVFVGLNNFLDFAEDDLFQAAMGNAVKLTLFYSALPIIVGFLLASSLARVRVRAMAPLRTLLFLPAVVAPVVVAVRWRLIYEPTNGLLNQLLTVVGAGGLARPWLGDFDLALPAVGIVATWMEYGLVMVLFLAGIQKIPLELYDAARVDGAGVVQEFFAVTLPGLRNELAVAVVVTVIASFRNFDLVFNLSRGGPGTSTDVPVLEVYRRGFLHGEVGSAAAIGLTIAIVVLLVTAIMLAFARGRGE